MLRFALPLLALMLPALPGAQAQEAWPSRPITILGGFPNGAGTDIYARKLAEPLGQALGVAVVVDSRTGAGGNIASDLVAKARPDGYTFLLATAGTHAINAALYKSLTFDVMRDFTHVALLGDVPNVLLVNPAKTPDIRSCRDLMALAKARPGALNYASTGNGASTHLAAVQFANAAGIEAVHVPYRGQGPAMTALLSGDVTFFFNQSGPSIAAVQQGQARALAVSTPSRLPPLPDVPTVAEGCGLPGFVSTTWYGLLAPAGLPAPILARVSREVIRIISEPAFKEWLVTSQGIAPAEDPSPEAFRRIHQADLARWAEVVKQSGATVD
jgi:tripartite-type tricarboxylate transporter receptor subunit TctC